MTETIESIYLASPVWVQQQMVGTYGWWWYRRRFGNHFHRLVSEFKLRERCTKQQFATYQKSQLRKVFTAAWRSPFYRSVFDKARLKSETEPFEALRRLPFLTKERSEEH